MCYSPEADLVAGVVVGAIGVDALRHVEDRRYLPLAAVPIVLATHQLIEAAAWWGLQDRVSQATGESAVTAYLIIALGIVPLLVPFAVMRSEPNPVRQRWMTPFVWMGLVVAVALLTGLATGGYSASIGGRFLAYEIATPGGGIIGVFYVLAVCTPFLLSSQQRLVLFGVINVLAVAVLTLLLSSGLISLWCVWAAISSVVVARHIREVSGVTRTRTHRIATG